MRRKKKVALFALFFCILVLSVISVSAFWPFDGFKKKLSFTGEVVKEFPSLSDGVISYWAFNEPANSADPVYNAAYWLGISTLISEDAAEGVRKGAQTNIQEGIYNTSGYFDGIDDSIEVSALNAFNVPQFSVSVWVKSSKESQNGGIVEKTVGGEVNTQWLLFAQGESYYFRIKPATETYADISSAGLNKDSWVHLVGTFNNDEIKFYRNGVLANSKSVSGPIATGSGPLLMGRLGGNFYPFNGFIDEVVIYNRALSSTEVNALYTTQKEFLGKDYQTNTGDCQNIKLTPTGCEYSATTVNVSLRRDAGGTALKGLRFQFMLQGSSGANVILDSLNPTTQMEPREMISQETILSYIFPAWGGLSNFEDISNNKPISIRVFGQVAGSRVVLGKADSLICPASTAVQCSPVPVTSCIDSDGGKNYSIKGNVTSGAKVVFDRCYNNSLLLEMFCDISSSMQLDGTGIAEIDRHECGEGMRCDEGVCLNEKNPYGVLQDFDLIKYLSYEEGIGADIVDVEYNKLEGFVNGASIKYSINKSFDNSSINNQIAAVVLEYSKNITFSEFKRFIDSKYKLYEENFSFVYRDLSDSQQFLLVEPNSSKLPLEKSETYYWISGNKLIEILVLDKRVMNWIDVINSFDNFTGSYLDKYISTLHEEELQEPVIASENLKNMSKYSEREVFLISDKSWKDVLPLVPVTTWTGNETNCTRGYGTPENVCVYPTLIYHSEDKIVLSTAMLSSGIGTPPAEPGKAYSVNGKSLVRFKVDENTKKELLKSDLDIAAVSNNYIDIVLTKEQKNFFGASGYDFETIPVNARNTFEGSSDEASYRTYNETIDEMLELANTHKDIAKVYEIGKSIENRSILAIKISDGVQTEEDETSILVVGNHHAREVMTVEVPMAMIEFLLGNYDTNPEIKKIIDNYQLWFVPMVNPDGHVAVENGDIFWRKNRRDNNNDGIINNLDGVDLNRNYGYTWDYAGAEGPGSSTNPSAETYRGASEFSEPETQAIRDLTLQHNFSYVLDYHSYAGVILYPWGHIEDPTPDDNTFKGVANGFKNILSDYQAGHIPDIVGFSRGDSIDWFYGEQTTKKKIIALGIELGNDDFNPPASEIKPTVEKQIMVLLNLTGYPLEFRSQEMIDADSIIYFMQQYQNNNEEKVTIIGNTTQELDNLLIAQPELGAGIQQGNINRISTQNYLSYWESYKDVVYVEDNYELALMASTYASLINAPLIIQGSSLDASSTFSGRNVTCIGNVDRNCSEKYNLEQLQKKYVELTATKKIIITNPEDLQISASGNLITKKTNDDVSNLYSKTSLIAPFLASSKHEIIISKKDDTDQASKVQTNITNFFESNYHENISSCDYNDQCAKGFSNNPISMIGVHNSISFFFSGKADVLIKDVQPEILFTNGTNKIDIIIGNIGFNEAKDVVLNAYEIIESTSSPSESSSGGGGSKMPESVVSSDSREMKFIGTVRIGDLEEDDEKVASINWVPSKVGQATLFFNVSTSSEETNIGNNDRLTYFEVKGPQPDVAVSAEYPNKLVLNEVNLINVSVSNVGTKNTSQVNVSFYWIDYNSDYTGEFKNGTNTKINIKGKEHSVEIIGINFLGQNALISIDGISKEVFNMKEYLFDGLKVYVGNIYLNSEEAFVYLVIGDSKILIEKKTFDSLNAGEMQKINFEFIPRERNYYNFLIKAETEGDDILKNNEVSFSLLAAKKEPEINSYIELPEYFFVNEEGKFEIYFSNSGVSAAKNAFVEFYVERYPDNVVLVERKQIGDITEEEKRVSFNWKPLKEGYYEMIFNVSYEYEGSIETKEIKYGTEVKKRGADVSAYLYAESVALGKSGSAAIEISNIGSENANNVKYFLYDNDQLIKEENIGTMETRDSKKISVEWTPEGIGRHVLRVHINADSDINLENNDYQRDIYVYKTKSVRFSILNSTGSIEERFLGRGVDGLSEVDLINKDNPGIFEMPDMPAYIYIIKADRFNVSNQDNEKNNKFVVSEFQDSGLHGQMLVFSEYYEGIQEDTTKRLYSIYANEVFWNYGYERITFNYPDYSEIGITNTDNLTIYYCQNWDFEFKSCFSGWQEASWISKQIEDNHLLVSTSVGSAEAFALGEKKLGTFNSEIRTETKFDFEKMANEYTNKKKAFGTISFSEGADDMVPANNLAHYNLLIKGFFYNCSGKNVEVGISLNNEIIGSERFYCYKSIPFIDKSEYYSFSYSKAKNLTLTFDADLVFYNENELARVNKNYETELSIGRGNSSGVSAMNAEIFSSNDKSEFVFENKNFSFFVVHAEERSGELSDLDIYANGEFAGSIDMTNTNGEKAREFALPEKAKAEKIINISIKSKNPGKIYLADVEMKSDFNPYYLTIVASPDAISIYQADNNKEADFGKYADINGDGEGELATGRVMGLTISDVSGYLARDLFYNKIEGEKILTMIMMGDPRRRETEIIQRIPQSTCGTNFCKCYFDNECSDIFNRYTPHFSSYLVCNESYGNVSSIECDMMTNALNNNMFNSSLSVYADHGSPNGWHNIQTSDLKNLQPQLGYSFACSTCEYGSEKEDLFCANMIRQGAIGYIGAVRSMYGHHFLDEFLEGTLEKNQSIGYAFKIGKNKEVRGDWATKSNQGGVYGNGVYGIHDVLIGDPSFNGRLGN